MGTTPNHSFPYPEGTDLVIAGDDAIQSLAETVDAAIEWNTGAVFPREESPSGVGAPAVVVFGSPSKLDGFTYDGGALTYTGPPRVFIIDVEVQTSQAPSVGTVYSSVELRYEGAPIAGAYDMIASPTDSVGRDIVHRITTPGRLNTGDTIDVVAAAGPAGFLGNVGLRVYPISTVGA